MSGFFQADEIDGERLHAPATARNRDPILDVLKTFLPESGTILEIAAGTGEHAVHFSNALPYLHWQPTDIAPDNLVSIDAWRSHIGTPSLLPPMKLDVMKSPWPVETNEPIKPVTGIVAINLVHISPWAVTEKLIEGAARVLQWGGVFYMYGPYKFEGEHISESNEVFDRSLTARNPDWGVREMSHIRMLAEGAGFAPPDIIPMPANNHSLVFRRA